MGKKGEVLTGQIRGTQKWKERRHSTNKYLLSAYHVPGTVRTPPKIGKKKKMEAGKAKSEGKNRVVEEKAEGTEKPGATGLCA